MRKIILASSSPRRRKILENMGLEFEVIPSGYEEIIEDNCFSYEKIEELAYYKAKNIADKLHSQSDINYSLIIGADTVVVLDDKIMGKPKSKKDAFAMLKTLSGKRHFVVTSICVIEGQTKEKKQLSITSYVEFEELSDDLIRDYIEKFKPFDKAGAYGIQELPKGFVKSIEGSFENIIGLCPLAVNHLLNSK